MERKRVAGRFVREGLDGDRGVQGFEKQDAGAKEAKAKAPLPKACRTFTRARVAEALPDSLERFVEEAKKGSIAHAKMLANLGGLDKGEQPVATKRRGKSVVGKLLDKMAREPEQ